MPTQHMLPHIQLTYVQTGTQTGPAQVQPNLTHTTHHERSDGQTLFVCWSGHPLVLVRVLQ